MRFQRTFGLILISLSLVFLAAEGFAAESRLADLPGLDSVSAGCVFCHNGSEGAHAGFCLLSQGGGKASGHVISAAYADLANRNRGIRPMDNLPSEVVLHDGKISCATCHGSDPHSGAPLVMDNSGSALCQACHLK